ncbi:Pentatricopeptide repeat-containing protein At2g13600, partial [Linum perenne]
VRFSESTLSTVLSVCARIGEDESSCSWHGKQVHCIVMKSSWQSFELVGSSLLHFYASCQEIGEAKLVFDELAEWNETVWSSMLVGYVRCGLMSDAYEVFVRMPRKDVVSWTALISGYDKSEGGCEKALSLFQWMRRIGEVVPNEFTLDCVVRVCGKLGALMTGMCVHGISIKCGLVFDQSVGCALVGLYCDCENVDYAKEVYSGIAKQSLDASNSLIQGFLLMGRIDEAELLFYNLSERSFDLYNLMIKGYAVSGRVEDSKRLFESLPQKSVLCSNTMISVYSRNGEIHKACMLFEEVKGERNPVTWNSMMSSFIQNEQHEEAVKLYVRMRQLQINCTRSTFSVIFRACSGIGLLHQGKMLHTHAIRMSYESNIYVATSLVDMYSKCGSISDAWNLFSSISSPNVAAWTALINGYAHHGLGSEAILLFKHMLEQRIVPNGATFVGCLAACVHAGLIDEGMEIFLSMDKAYGVTPTLEHYTCVVDLLGRSGRVLEAEKFVKEIPFEADIVVWATLLNACCFWKNIEAGERVAEYMFNMFSEPASAHVILSNMYAVLDKWGRKMAVRNRLRSLEVKKDPGCSWIELNSSLHVFSVESRRHPQSSFVYATLDHLTANLACSLERSGFIQSLTE